MKILAQLTLCEDMMMCYGIAHNNMIDCKCKQGTIYLAKVLFCNWRCHVRKHYTALQISILVQMIEIYIYASALSWHDSSMIFIILHHILFGAIYHNFKLEFWMIIILFLRSSPSIWLWVDCVWILINIFLWHYKRHLYTHTLFQMSPYHVLCIFVTYIRIMYCGAICSLHKL